MAEFIKAPEDSGETGIAVKMREKSGDSSETIRIWFEERCKQFDKNITDGHDLVFASSFLQDKELTFFLVGKIG